MATSTRPSRRAAHTVSYADADPDSSEDDEAMAAASDEDDYGRKGKRSASKARKKQKLASANDLSDSSDSDHDSSDSGALSPQQFAYDRSRKKDVATADDKVKYAVPRVNPVNRLPVELLLKIFSYLHAATLCSLSKTSRSLRHLLTSKTFTSLWRHAMRPHIFPLRNPHSSVTHLSTPPRPAPKVAGEDVDLRLLASVMFDTECAYCGKDVERSDRYLLRTLCAECRTANLVVSTEIAKGKDKKLQDLHPATIQCVIPTLLAPYDVKWPRSRQWILTADLWAQSEVLEELQMEDDGDVEGLVKEGVNVKDVHKTLGRVKRLKRRTWYRKPQQKGAQELEDELVKMYTPRVQEYVLERKALLKDRNALAQWIMSTADALYDERDLERGESATFKAQVGLFRREAILERIGKERVFDLGTTQRNKLATFALAVKPEPLTDDIWLAIKGVIYGFIARDVAQNIFTRVGKKLKDDWDEDDEDEGLFKKPKSVTKAGWAYVRPELVKVAKEYEVKKEEHAAEQLKLQALAPREPFFVERFTKCFAMTSSKQAGWTMPRYAEWRLLPTVVDLWNDPDFAVDTSEAGRADDLEAFGRDHLETVLDEMADFALETRAEALRSILAATTDLGEDDDAVAAFDAVAALHFDGEYGDPFFLRASSYVSCAQCATFFGPLNDVLKHVHQAHPLSSLYVPALRRDARTVAELGPRVDLSLEVACAWSAILELAQLDDTDDGLVSDAQLDAAFKGKMLLWENGPRRTKKRGRWADLLWRVTQAARNAHEDGDVLDVPVIALKNLTRRERLYQSWGRGW
ncbi:uncharacterized protein RHOBADRAFT_45310 [Rhodotorula graminis WP1]|uniref:F-box domain-containing protein n=1 Tax=Rhodotorula graminis (strain WP1) TaxID=578459 RepID=A0A0P9FE19_RHOGW|nr:uncharacterized protein RHOBADRAFT_45310 [Rhodotorula graminis WP1]KPV74014.1 hypothetical protein RHOBADRAFT_45310 [Rhodotorula graminis WP1]